MDRVLGIVGAGKLGTTLGLAASDADWQVLMCDIAPAEVVAMIVETMVPQAQLVSLPELVARADIVMLAVPFGLSGQLDYSLLDGKVVLDPMNNWPAVDGDVAELHGWTGSTTALIAARNPKMRIVKTLNHLGYHDMETDARPAGHAERRAVAAASDDLEARAAVAALLDDLGFDPVELPFAAARQLEGGGPVFGRWVDASGLRSALSRSGVRAT